MSKRKGVLTLTVRRILVVLDIKRGDSFASSSEGLPLGLDFLGKRPRCFDVSVVL